MNKIDLKNIRLSIIIPGYNNSARWWERCVRSVLASCGPNEEIICVDDGSKEPVQPSWVCADEDARVKLLHKKNGGLASARNAGLAVARGHYVTFIDSDDEVVPGLFNSCIQQMEMHSAEIAVYGVRTIWPDIKLQKEDALPTKYYEKLSATDIQTWSNAYLLNYVWNKVYLRAFLEGKNSSAQSLRFYPQGMPCEDIIFNLSCVMNGARWVMVEDVGYVYYRTRGTLLSCYKPSNFEGLKAGAEAWQQCAVFLGEEQNSWFQQRARFTEAMANQLEWQNIWLPKTPYSLWGRWKWQRSHSGVGGIKVFFKMFVYTILRRYCYFNCVRKWHIKRLFPHVKEVVSSCN